MPLFENKYGHFSNDGREYTITRPDTPMPWINVISNGDYGLIVSQAGSGYSWRTHASMNRITRWEQDLIRDEWGKYIFIRDEETGEFWSTSLQPVGERLEDYRVTHGMGFTVIEGRAGGLKSGVTYFASLNAPCEVWLLRLENNGASIRSLQLFTYFEWLLGSAPDWHREFHRIFIETRYLEEQGVLLAEKVLWDIPAREGSHWNRGWPYVAFHSTSFPVAGFDSDKLSFLGRHGKLQAPQAVVSGQSHGNQGRWGDPIGSLQTRLTLNPGQEIEVVFCLGAAGNQEEALALADRYREPANARNDLVEVQAMWKEMLSQLDVETPEPAADLMVNTWLPYQAIAGRLWGRTAYYQTGGAFGFRDQLQDSLTWLLLGKPERTLNQIRLHAAHQFQDGIVLHWWHPLAETGLRSKYSDDLLWLPYVVLYYLKETGNREALGEEIPFYDRGSASLLEHCRRSFKVALERRSGRGLPLILEGDWNDGLNAVGREGRGESVWMAHFLHYLLEEWASLPVLGEQDRERFRREAAALREAVEAHGWDGSWYLRATTDSGKLLGSSQNEEGKLFLNAQTWAVLSGTASQERARQAMQSAREALYTNYGALLFAPAYAVPNPEIGYLSRYAPGVRENGGVYVHAACWAVLAERALSGAQAAWDLWQRFCPPIRGLEPDLYSGEPYVMPGNVEGPLSRNPGKGGWTWYTGSSGWYLRAFVEGVLGITAELDGLRVAGDLPDGWDGYRLKRVFRGATYHIQVSRDTQGTGPACLIDQQPWVREGRQELLPVFPPGTEHQVEIRAAR
jgi:cellobiose phosphorylase